MVLNLSVYNILLSKYTSTAHKAQLIQHEVSET